ncbi:DUF6164 family protein [Granulosicoccus antarcticus]|uniref:DUF2007 domain-containing protein n=1 Tax=Granulosicoccus antarcticus IMCC3135 TaxID=1192854 RepID=A0A2Z2P1R7_9GAMM|nr:DUF6164 family protein [Granulosicoccus antarcticus]ASJ76501.1 hypothetical protein IMCC3135_32280 [Granulosicoccus antarcticus IMCC3135]
MSALVFRLRNVPQDEAADVRALLDEHEIEWYETTAGNWGVAMPGIWASHEEDLPKARNLINDYQSKRGENQRQQYAENLRSGDTPTLLQRIRTQPLQMGGIIVFCLFILYIMINPFLQLIGHAS